MAFQIRNGTLRSSGCDHCRPHDRLAVRINHHAPDRACAARYNNDALSGNLAGRSPGPRLTESRRKQIHTTPDARSHGVQALVEHSHGRFHARFRLQRQRIGRTGSRAVLEAGKSERQVHGMPYAMVNRLMDNLFRITEIEYFQPDGIRIRALVDELQAFQGLDAVKVHQAGFQNRAVRRGQRGYSPQRARTGAQPGLDPLPIFNLRFTGKENTPHRGVQPGGRFQDGYIGPCIRLS